jgi:hypothetical protein
MTSTCHCGRTIEHDRGEWVHVGTGWRMCDPRSRPLEYATPRISLPVPPAAPGGAR